MEGERERERKEREILLLLRREGELCSLHRVERFSFSLSLSISAIVFSADSLYCVSLCYVTLLCHSAMSLFLLYVSLSAMALCYVSRCCVSLSADFPC